MAGSPFQGHRYPTSASRPTDSLVKNADPVCTAVVVPFPDLTPLDVQSMLVPLMESGQSELQHLIAVHLEEVLRPLRKEASTIKLWLACVASRLERVEPCEEHASISDLADLFGPCSQVQRSPTPLILASLAAACTHADCVMREDTQIMQNLSSTR
jgi:hypothetical protein